jgi:hypothetical protein
MIKVALAALALAGAALASEVAGPHDPAHAGIGSIVGMDFDSARSAVEGMGYSLEISECGDRVQAFYRTGREEQGVFAKERYWRGCTADIVEITDDRLWESSHWFCQWTVLIDNAGIVREVMWNQMWDRYQPGTEGYE